jgi:hypothetical protein
MKGFDLTAWVMPFVMLCLGGVFLGWVVVRMARPSRGQETVPAAAVPVDPRIEKELRDFEQES